jgi:TRAP-type C4-dicarboxylate transport system permease small subunit
MQLTPDNAIGARLARRAEDVIALLLGLMFVAFIVQIVFRYFFNLPIGWTSELSVVAWLWLVLWGAAFVLRDDEEIRFDLLYSAVGPRMRRAMTLAFATAIIALYAGSLPASLAYVRFMKVESTSYLKIRFDLLYSIYVIFVVAVIVRHAWMIWTLLRKPASGADEATVDR